MKVNDQVEYDLFKMVAQTIIMKGGDMDRIPHNFNKIKNAAIKLGFIAETEEKTVAKQDKKMFTIDKGQA